MFVPNTVRVNLWPALRELIVVRAYRADLASELERPELDAIGFADLPCSLTTIAVEAHIDRIRAERDRVLIRISWFEAGPILRFEFQQSPGGLREGAFAGLGKCGFIQDPSDQQ